LLGGRCLRSRGSRSRVEEEEEEELGHSTTTTRHRERRRRSGQVRRRRGEEETGERTPGWGIYTPGRRGGAGPTNKLLVSAC
jgi:hypothetical protein